MPIGHRSAGNTVQLIVTIIHLRGFTAVVAYFRHTIIRIIGILRLVVLVGSRFVERLDTVLLIIFNQSTVF